MSEGKRMTRVIIDGKEIEVDIDTLTKEQAEKLGIHVQNSEEYDKLVFKRKMKKLKHKILAVTPLLALFVYLLLGFLAGLWSWGALAFTAIPLSWVLCNLSLKNLKAQFYFVLVLAVIAGFFLVGFLVDGGWAWSWTLFLLIPIAAIILEV